MAAATGDCAEKFPRLDLCKLSVALPLHSREQLLVPYPATLAAEPPLCMFRSTLLVGLTQTLKRHGFYEKYVAALPPQHLTTILSSAGMWLPIEVGLAHYQACDALNLSSDEQLRFGGEVVMALQRTFIGTVLKAASLGVGVGPLTGLEKFATVYARTIKGGGVCVVRVGPKDVRVDCIGLPHAQIPYFRVAYRGFIRRGCELLRAPGRRPVR